MVKVAEAFRLVDVVICEDKNLKIVLDEQANGSHYGSETLARMIVSSISCQAYATELPMNCQENTSKEARIAIKM